MLRVLTELDYELHVAGIDKQGVWKAQNKKRLLEEKSAFLPIEDKQRDSANGKFVRRYCKFEKTKTELPRRLVVVQLYTAPTEKTVLFRGFLN